MSPARDLARHLAHREQKSFTKKIKQSRKREVRSPTKRLMDMKNAHVRNGKKAQARGGAQDTMLYTVSPTEAYLVKKEYGPDMTAANMTKVEHAISDRIDSFIEDGKVYLGREKIHRHEQVQRLHSDLKGEGSPSRVHYSQRVALGASPSRAIYSHSTSATGTSPDQRRMNVLADMEAEASRICESLTGKR